VKNARLGPYEILRTIGRGGMAEVLLARIVGADDFEREVVIKRILPEYANERDFVDMFRDEARITAQLRHGNIAQVIELRADGEQYSLVLEYVDGPPLSTIAQVLRASGRTMPHGLVAHLLVEVARALDYAHRKRGADGTPLGVVHRDVSPSNVLVSRDGEVKLADFGIARATSRISSTQAGGVKGKLAYIAPEALMGEATSRSDLFSLGVMGFELIAGHLPFDAETNEARMFKVLSVDAPHLATLVSDVPPVLAELIARLLEKDPAVRPARASEIVDALAPLVAAADHPAEALAALVQSMPVAEQPPAPPPTRAVSRVERKPMSVLIVEASATTRALIRRGVDASLPVIEVADAAGALAAARGTHLALVLSQQLLPGGTTGVELCRQLRALPGHERVTFALVVFESSPEIVQKAREAGVSHIVSKSDPAALIQRVRGLVSEVA